MKIEEMIPRNFDQLLAELGLQKRESPTSYVLPALGIFAAGAVVGGALALMLAPSSGRELRSEVEKKFRSATAPKDHEPSREAGNNSNNNANA